MLLGFLKNRDGFRQKDHIQPIKLMLEQTWDLSKEFSVPPDPITADAIGVFNLFLKKLNGIVGSILKSVVSLSSIAPSLFKFSTEFKDQCLKQKNKIIAISKAGVSMADSIGKIAENTDTLASDSESLEKQVQDTMLLGKKSMEQFKEISTFVNDLVNTINDLNENSISIGSIIEVISTISDETTILSLNARIEASRRDSDGKGFKVIAEEIAALAKQTKDATRDIQERLDILRSTVTGTVDAVKNVEKNVKNGEALINDSSTALKNVYAGFESLSGNIAIIKASTSNQSKDVKTISKDILDIENSIKSQSTAVETIVKTTGKINHLCDDMIVQTGIFHLSTHKISRDAAEKMAMHHEIQSMTRMTRENAMTRFLKEYRFIELAYITDGEGTQVTRNVYSENVKNEEELENGYGRNWSEKEWFKEPKRKGSTFVSKIYRSSATNRFCFTVSVPMFDKKSLFLGVLAIDINFEDILKVKSGKS